MNRSCLCECLATMRLLLHAYLIIWQRFTINARFISFNLQSLTSDKHPFLTNTFSYTIILATVAIQINAPIVKRRLDH